MKLSKKHLYILLGFFIALPYALLLSKAFENRTAKFILIDKETMSLSVIDYKGKRIAEYPIACGKNFGNKQEEGDMRTPEGVFLVSEVKEASAWKHDFHDGNGEIEGAYGPYFIRLDTPNHKGIGIHGTHLPESIGTRSTEGCIRLNNKNVKELKELVRPGMIVVITPSSNDAKANGDDR